jgi:hypothetical protein
MWRPDFSRSGLLTVLLLLVLAAPGPTAAQGRESAPPATQEPASAAERRVRDAVLARFRVLPVQDGIVLVPLGRYEGVDNIELRAGTIAINGKAVTGGEVRQRLGRDADPVLELSYLDLPLQQRLLLPPGASERGEAPPPRPEAPPAEPSAPESPSTPSTVPEEPERVFHQQSDGRVRIGGNITVDEDEQINGPVVAVGGSIRVDGRVRDDVVSVGGNVHLGPKADIRGDVTVVGGTLSRAPGAQVRGRVNEVGFGFPVGLPIIHVRPSWSPRFLPWISGGPWYAIRFVGTLLRMALVGLLATLVLLLAPRAVERVGHAVRTQVWKSALVGLLAELLFIPLIVITTVVLAVSIIGIPLLVLVPFVVLAFFVALLLGFTGAAYGLARSGQSRFSWSSGSAFVHLIVGLTLIWGVTVVGRTIALGGGPFALIGELVVIVGFLLEYAAWTVGLGGALLTRFGRRGPLPATIPPVPAVPATPAGLPHDGLEPPPGELPLRS